MEKQPFIPESVAKEICRQVSLLSDDELLILICSKRKFNWEEIYFARKEMQYRIDNKS